MTLDRPDFRKARRHGRNCFCYACLQDEMYAMEAYIEELERLLFNLPDKGEQ